MKSIGALAAVFVIAFLSGCMTMTDGSLQSGVSSIAKINDTETTTAHRQPYGFAFVSGFSRRGERSQRFEIRHGDCGGSRDWDDCTTDRARFERKESPKNSYSRPGEGVWYGYSIFIPSDFQSIHPANTHLSQVKVSGELMPLWQLTFNDHPYILFVDGDSCPIGSLSRWRGQWNDITIYAHYGYSGQDTYFQLYHNDRLICQRDKPLLPQRFEGQNPQIGMKYGIYNSFVSRYLSRHATRTVNTGSYTQSASPRGASSSPSARPFEVDWGVRLPTHVIHYDEMLAGPRREDVDVRMREARGLPPVD